MVSSPGEVNVMDGARFVLLTAILTADEAAVAPESSRATAVRLCVPEGGLFHKMLNGLVVSDPITAEPA
jgi:hypothetical protein